MTDHEHEHEYESETYLDIDLSEATSSLVRASAKAFGCFIFSEAMVRPFLSEITGRKLRRWPIFAGTYLLWNFFVQDPGYRVMKESEERRERALVEQEIREAFTAHEEEED